MPGKAAKVTITERQQGILEELSRSRSEAQMISQRAQIILLAFQGLLNQEIADQVGLERKQLGLWRRRWQAAWESLTLLECSEPRRLREAIRETLRDAHRSGAPGTFTAEQITQILAVACEKPELSGRPITHWTHRELREEVIQRGIVEEISVSRIGHFLREAALQPHRRKMWLNTKERDPQVFQQAVETVCQTYHEAAKLHEQNGAHTVSTDEMTGIQALERVAPAKGVKPDQIARDEFEYTRHGTTTLIGNLDVVTGTMISPSLGPTRTEEDFVKHIENTIAADADGEWIFLVDTLNIHWSAGLVEWVAQRCEPETDLGKKRRGRRFEESGEPPGFPVGSLASHPLRVPAQAQFVAEPDRDGLRNHHEESGSPGELPFGGGPGKEVASIPGILQPDNGPPLYLDLHRQAASETRPERILSAAPPPQTLESETG
jgi:transposase